MKRLMVVYGLILVLLLTACGASSGDISEENDRVLAELKVENDRVIAEIKNAQRSEEFMDSFVSSLMSNPEYRNYLEWSEEDIDSLVSSMMSSPEYQDYLEWSEEDIEQLAAAFMSDLGYVEMLKTTPKEDCAQIVVMAIIIGGEHFIPSDDEAQELCEWYEDFVDGDT